MIERKAARNYLEVGVHNGSTLAHVECPAIGVDPAFVFDRNPVGRIMTRLTADVDALNELFTSGVVSIFGDVLTLSGITIAMLVINFNLALVTLSVVPLLFLATTIFRKKARAAFS